MNKIMELAIDYASNYANGGGDKSALQAEVTRMEAEELKLHASLAEAVLQAQAGWERYESSNNLVKGYQVELADYKQRYLDCTAQTARAEDRAEAAEEKLESKP